MCVGQCVSVRGSASSGPASFEEAACLKIAFLLNPVCAYDVVRVGGVSANAV